MIGLQSTLIIAGVAFVGAAIVGGGLVAFKVEIPLVDSVARQTMLGVFGMSLLVAGFTLGGTGEADGEPADSPAATVASQAEPETTVSTTSSTSASSSTLFEVAASTTAPPQQPEREWVLVIDDGGKLGITIPSDWSVVVEEDAIWASPAIDEWIDATSGNGPATHEGYYVRRIRQPDTGALQDIANEHLREMPVPTQCAMALSTFEPVEAAAFVYRIYECAPGGTHVNEVEVGINPPWVTLESSRYLDEDQRESVHAVIWQSLRTY